MPISPKAGVRMSKIRASLPLFPRFQPELALRFWGERVPHISPLSFVRNPATYFGHGQPDIRTKIANP